MGPHLPAAAGQGGFGVGWTGREPLPGGDFPVDGFEALVAEIRARWPFLAPAHARRLARHYGTAARAILGDAGSMADLGRDFGATLTEAELDHLVTREWARTAADVAWRRTKLGLRLTPAEMEALDAALGGKATAAPSLAPSH